MERKNSTFDVILLPSISESESKGAAEGRGLEVSGGLDERAESSRSRRYSRLELTCTLVGRGREFADLERPMASPMSNADGRWLSRDGREEAGDLGMVRVAVCDLDL